MHSTKGEFQLRVHGPSTAYRLIRYSLASCEDAIRHRDELRCASAFQVLVVWAFSAMMLALATVGTYDVTANGVSERTSWDFGQPSAQRPLTFATLVVGDGIRLAVHRHRHRWDRYACIEWSALPSRAERATGRPGSVFDRFPAARLRHVGGDTCSGPSRDER